MTEQLHHMPPLRLPAARPRPGLIALGLAAAALLAVILTTDTGHATRPLAAPCDSLDAAASGALTRLVADPSAAAESRARDALFRLQRARKNCRLGLAALARQDYAAITRQQPGRYNRRP
jgi:hypothetical protein